MNTTAARWNGLRVTRGRTPGPYPLARPRTLRRTSAFQRDSRGVCTGCGKHRRKVVRPARCPPQEEAKGTIRAWWEGRPQSGCALPATGLRVRCATDKRRRTRRRERPRSEEERGTGGARAANAGHEARRFARLVFLTSRSLRGSFTDTRFAPAEPNPLRGSIEEGRSGRVARPWRTPESPEPARARALRAAWTCAARGRPRPGETCACPCSCRCRAAPRRRRGSPRSRA
jgi:hypothetical protein